MAAPEARLRPAPTFLAGTRWAGVGLALAVEAAVLVGLALAPPSAALGIPAAVAAAIAGTVAVVFGAPDGVLVAFAGACVFAATGGWRAGELAALVVWPAIVAAAGVFARRVELRRLALGHVVTAQEQERKRLALELHDQTAQVLASALLTLRAADRLVDTTAAAEAAGQARELIDETIQALRALAVELSPRVLEDYGLTPALERLTAAVAERTGLAVRLETRWSGRASDEVELALYRLIQDALSGAVADGAQGANVLLDYDRDAIIAEVEQRGGGGHITPATAHEAQRERLRLLGGTLTTAGTRDGGRRLRADVPATPRRAG